MIRLSIIVPFYNVEKYIEQCIRSLYDQDIPQEEYEVICVDDCSPDGSRAIVERLQWEYPTLQLICHTENKRQGGARNTGLRVAKGEYIWFVDSDDYVRPNVLKILLSKAESTNLDILQFGYGRDCLSDTLWLPRSSESLVLGEDYLFSYRGQQWIGAVTGPWLQFYRRNFLFENRLFFTEYIQYEDTDFVIHAFLKAKFVSTINVCAYHYRINLQSTTNSMFPNKMVWLVRQLLRCAKLEDDCRNPQSKEKIRTMVEYSLSNYRKVIGEFSSRQKIEYLQEIGNIHYLKNYVSWRTWLAIQYAITCFV